MGLSTIRVAPRPRLLSSLSSIMSLSLGLAFVVSRSSAWAYRGFATSRVLHRASRAPVMTTGSRSAFLAPSVTGGWCQLAKPAGGASPRSMMTTSRKATATTDTMAGDRAWKINLLYDSDCPLCMKEVEFLRKRDIEEKIRFTDLNDLNYRPEENGGVDFESGMKVIHAVLPDGTAVKGVEVFRRVYDLLGLGWVYAATRWPVLGPAVDRLYDVWATNRLRITGRPDLEEILRERAEKLRNTQFDDCSDSCDLGDDF